MNIFQRIGKIFQRSGKTSTKGTRQGFFTRIFRRGKNQTAAPEKNAADFINKEISDKDIQNRAKFNSFNQNNPDMQLTMEEWNTMVTTLGTMGDTIEKFGYEAFKQLVQDLHDENISLSKSDMAYVINESMGIMRNSDKTFTQEDAMDLLRERIYLEYGEV